MIKNRFYFIAAAVIALSLLFIIPAQKVPENNGASGEESITNSSASHSADDFVPENSATVYLSSKDLFYGIDLDNILLEDFQALSGLEVSDDTQICIDCKLSPEYPDDVSITLEEAQKLLEDKLGNNGDFYFKSYDGFSFNGIYYYYFRRFMTEEYIQNVPSNDAYPKKTDFRGAFAVHSETAEIHPIDRGISVDNIIFIGKKLSFNYEPVISKEEAEGIFITMLDLDNRTPTVYCTEYIGADIKFEYGVDIYETSFYIFSMMAPVESNIWYFLDATTGKVYSCKHVVYNHRYVLLLLPLEEPLYAKE